MTIKHPPQNTMSVSSDDDDATKRAVGGSGTQTANSATSRQQLSESGSLTAESGLNLPGSGNKYFTRIGAATPAR